MIFHADRHARFDWLFPRLEWLDSWNESFDPYQNVPLTFTIIQSLSNKTVIRSIFEIAYVENDALIWFEVKGFRTDRESISQRSWVPESLKMLWTTFITLKPRQRRAFILTTLYTLNSVLLTQRNSDSKWSKLTLTPNIP